NLRPLPTRSGERVEKANTLRGYSAQKEINEGRFLCRRSSDALKGARREKVDTGVPREGAAGGCVGVCGRGGDADRRHCDWRGCERVAGRGDSRRRALREDWGADECAGWVGAARDAR